jgi:hypothetical protein
VRTLPLRVAPGAGEALDSWLTRLAHHNGIPLLWLVPVLGFGDRLRVPHNNALTWRLPTTLLRRIERQTGLEPGTLDRAVLDQFDPLGWKPLPGSRYCVACLTESGGRWPIRWQLAHTFACLRHRRLLASVCPGCQRPAHSGLSLRTRLLPSTRCTLGARRETRSCDADLLTAHQHRLPADDPRLAAQEWINQRLDRLDSRAVTDLRDLDALATWFRSRIQPSQLTHLDHAGVAAIIAYRDDHHGLRREQPTGTLVAAALAHLAIGLITADDRDRYRRFSPLLRDAYHTRRSPDRQPPARAPMILSHKRLTSLSQPLQRRLLTCADAYLPVSERLRYRTRTPTPRPPEPGSTVAADRARHIPQYLWPDWIVRFQPQRGVRSGDMAIDIPAALLIPGNPARNIHATGQLNPWRNNISVFLGAISQHYPDVLTAICRIAEYLDQHGSPIDYRRRRDTFTDVELSIEQWTQICARADANPGRAARLLHARRYLFQLLTGAHLANRQHALSTADPWQRQRYDHFDRQMTSPLRDQLHHHAAELLAAAGIDEPLTWSPPAACAAGLRLPGRDPDDIDMHTLRQLVLVSGIDTTTVARRLDVSIEHVRYALRHLHRPPRPHRKYSQPVAAETRARAATILTAEFFHREHIDNGKDLDTLVAETGFSRRLLRDHARQAGIKPVSPYRRARIKIPSARHGDRIDPDWLRHQAGTLFRGNNDIGAELGVTGETIRRYRRQYGIPSRPTGSGGHVVTHLQHPDLPPDIRHAVEGRRNGWQRLHRFQQMTAHPSLNSAAQAMKLHTQNLTLQLQRLEADIGAPLLHRAAHRHTQMTLTPRGRRLLDQLGRPGIRELLSRYAEANARPKGLTYKRNRNSSTAPSSTPSEPIYDS